MNFNYRNVVALALFSFFALVGCEKEDFTATEQIETISVNDKTASDNKGELAFADPKLITSIKGTLIKGEGKPSNTEGKNGAKEFNDLLDKILQLPAVRVSSDELDYDTYSYYVPTEDPSVIVNAIFSVEEDELTGGYVHVYRMTDEFALAFNSLSANFDEFEGELGILPLSSLKDLIYQPENKNGESDCFTYSFTLTPDSPSDGSGGPGGGVVVGPGPGGSTPGGGAGGSYVCIEVYGEDTSVPPCGCGKPADLCCYGGHLIILLEVNCTTIQTLTDNGDTGENKNFSIEDCGTLLSSVGVVPRNLTIPDVSPHVFEQISAAISETCFNEEAVMDIIDPIAFQSCYDSGVNPSTCISNQVLEYLNDLDFPSLNIPGTTLNLNQSVNFNNLSHDQQAISLNAAVAANGNEHVLQGIAAAVRKINNPTVNMNLSDLIFIYGSLSFNSTSVQEFISSTNSITSIYPIISEDISVTEISWLTNHPPTINGLSYLHSEEDYENIVGLVRDGLNDSDITSSEELLVSMANRVFLETAFIRGPSEYDSETDEENPSQRVRLDLRDDFLECFDEGPNDLDFLINDSGSFTNFQLKIHAEQPVVGTRTSLGPKSEWGHSFVTLSVTPLIADTGNEEPTLGDPIHITFGFYPSENMMGQPFATVDNEIVDNSRAPYHVAVEFEINQSQFNSVMETAVTNAETKRYDIEDYNCTDYVIDIANSLNNVSIPYTNSDYTFMGAKVGEGRNPGDFGEDIKNLLIGNLIIAPLRLPGTISTCP